MNEQQFLNQKQQLVQRINELLSRSSISMEFSRDLRDALDILEQYNFNNRYTMKGALSYFVVDSMQGTSDIGEALILFDKYI